jgi:Family of unknown function (DUF5677)
MSNASGPKHPYGFGVQLENDDFVARHPLFLARLAELHRFIDQVVARRLEKSGLVDRVVFYLGRLAVEDFTEVLLIVANGYGVAGTRLLRPMYERVVTMMYLIRHPEKTADFLDYDRVLTRKTINHLKAVGSDPTKLFPAEFLADVESRYQSVKDRFVEVFCDKCGNTRISLSWAPIDLATMAKEVDFAVHYPSLAYLSTLQIHTTAHGIMTRLEHAEGGGTAYKSIQRDEADAALGGAHLCLTVALDEHIKHFSLSGIDRQRLQQIFQECLGEYKLQFVEE